MTVFSATLSGVEPIPIEIEIDISSGLPFFQIVGLPDEILRESKTRVKSAIIQAGFDFPYDQRVVLNLAPSEIKKEGSSFELGLAARILAQTGQITLPNFDTLFLGELALDGAIRSVPEMGALAFAAEKMGALVISESGLAQLPQVPCPVVAIKKIQDLKEPEWWRKFLFNPESSRELNKELSRATSGDESFSAGDFERLQFSSFWAKHLEIAAVGGHHYLICGPPGCGKTFFAESLRALLDLLPYEPGREVKILNALFRRPDQGRPWSAPHHSATAKGLVGGGSPPRPGAVTKAHGGILFLDELLEFPAAVLDSLREPLEKGVIEIHRAGGQMTFPSRFQLIAATNPCRCGFWGHPLKSCMCRPDRRVLYQARLSGPFFDRLDVRLVVSPQLESGPTVSGAKILKNVRLAVKFRRDHFPDWDEGAQKYLIESQGQSMVSRRLTNKTATVAETLACLDGSLLVDVSHVREAQNIRAFDLTQRP